MADQDARGVMQGYLEALRDRGDFARFFAPDVRWTTMETGDEVVGRGEVRDHIAAFHSQAFDAHPELVGLIVGDDSAMLEARFIGTHIAEFVGIPATGANVDVPYCMAYDISGGVITALRSYLSIAGLCEQMTAAAAARVPVPAPR
jgi:predicted ester cyclase